MVFRFISLLIPVSQRPSVLTFLTRSLLPCINGPISSSACVTVKKLFYSSERRQEIMMHHHLKGFLHPFLMCFIRKRMNI